MASTARWRRSALSNGAGRCRRRAECCRDRNAAAPCVRPGYAPRRTHGVLAHFMAVVCKITYGSFIPLSTCGSYRIVSYRDILSDIVSYLSFSLMAVSCHHYYLLAFRLVQVSVVDCIRPTLFRIISGQFLGQMPIHTQCTAFK